MKRRMLLFLGWLAFVVMLYRIPAPLTASQGYPVPTPPYPGPGEAYLPCVMQANVMPDSPESPTLTIPLR